MITPEEVLKEMVSLVKQINKQGRIPTNPTDGYEKGSPEGANSCKSENLQGIEIPPEVELPARKTQRYLMSSKTNRLFDPLEYQARCVKLIEEAMVKPPPAEEPDWMSLAKDARLEALEAQEDEHNTNTLYGATEGD